MREREQRAVNTAKGHEQEAATLRATVREVTRQAKAAVEDGRIKAESAFLGRVGLSEEQQAARVQLKSLSQERDDLSTAAGAMVHYAATAFWSGNCAMPYGVQMSGWLDKMSGEKSKDKREGTGSQVAKKQAKQAKNWGRDMLDRTWKQRWFVLSGGCLYYFKSPDDASADPKGILFLHNACIQAAAFPSAPDQWWQGSSGRGSKFVQELGQGDDLMSIRLEGQSVSLNLRCKDESERIAWGTALQKHIAFCDYLERCWMAGQSAPSPHIAQLLLDVAPSEGIGARAAADGKLTAGHSQDLMRIVLPPGSDLRADASTELLSSMLGNAGQVQTVILRRVVMTGSGCAAVAAGLPSLTSLIELDLSHINLHESAVGESASTLMQALPRLNATMVTLRLDGLALDTRASTGLGRGLPALTQLQKLSLAGCTLGDNGLCAALGAECPQGHPLLPAVASDCFCDGCSTKGVEVIGTAFRCAEQCDFDLCSKCFVTGCRLRRVLASVQDLDLSANGLTGQACGTLTGDSVRTAFATKSKPRAPPKPVKPSRTDTVAILKGPRGFGMRECTVRSILVYSPNDDQFSCACISLLGSYHIYWRGGEFQ